MFMRFPDVIYVGRNPETWSPGCDLSFLLGDWEPAGTLGRPKRPLLEPGFIQPPADFGSLQRLVVFHTIERRHAVFAAGARVRAVVNLPADAETIKAGDMDQAIAAGHGH